MSRSVRQDLDKLRALQDHNAEKLHAYVQEGGTVRYIGALIPRTEEQLFEAIGQNDMRFHRKDVGHNVSPTNEDWAKYHRAKAGLLALQNYDLTEGLAEVEIPQPRPYTEYKFTETHDEWIERCHQLVQAERKVA